MRWMTLGVLLLSLWDGGALARERPLTSALLALSDSGSRAAFGVAADRERARAELARIAERVRRRAGRDPRGSSPIMALNDVVFDELGFTREVDDQGLAFALLPNVLASRRGNCVGLGTLYLALAEALGWRAEGVLRPGHFYVRIEDQGRMRNVELLRRGEEMLDGWYRVRWPASDSLGAYGRALSANEVGAVVAYDIGNELRSRQRLVPALRFYDDARARFPAFAEAHANAGVVAHLLGALDEASDAYRMAQRESPDLAGLAANMRLLDDERAAKPGALPPHGDVSALPDTEVHLR